MSPRGNVAKRDRKRFPRVSGDEPALQALDPSERAFSPRERG